MPTITLPTKPDAASVPANRYAAIRFVDLLGTKAIHGETSRRYLRVGVEDVYIAERDADGFIVKDIQPAYVATVHYFSRSQFMDHCGREMRRMTRAEWKKFSSQFRAQTAPAVYGKWTNALAVVELYRKFGAWQGHSWSWGLWGKGSKRGLFMGTQDRIWGPVGKLP